MKRIFVVGTSGSGKSTLAKELAKNLNYKHIELDSLMWLENWTKREANELKRLVQKQTNTESIVVDGNFLNYELKLYKGDVLIFLDYPRLLVFKRVLSRSIKRVITREKLWADNQEQARFLLSMNPELNPVLWAWKTHYRRRNIYQEFIAKLPKDFAVYRITNSQELAELKKKFSN